MNTQYAQYWACVNRFRRLNKILLCGAVKQRLYFDSIIVVKL